MNKVLGIIAVWITVAGLIGGAGINLKAARCGHPVQIANVDVFSWLAWPVVVAAVAVLDGDNVAYTQCNAPVEGE